MAACRFLSPEVSCCVNSIALDARFLLHLSLLRSYCMHTSANSEEKELLLDAENLIANRLAVAFRPLLAGSRNKVIGRCTTSGVTARWER